MTPSYLKRRRASLGLSQFGLASVAKVSRFNISQFELGYRQFTKDERQSITKALLKGASKNVADEKE